MMPTGYTGYTGYPSNKGPRKFNMFPLFMGGGFAVVWLLSGILGDNGVFLGMALGTVYGILVGVLACKTV